MPTTLDLGFVVVFTVIVTALQTLVLWPRFRIAAERGDPLARRNLYRRAIIGQWSLAAAAALIWIRAGRSWGSLGFRIPATRWQLVATVVAVAVGVMLACAQAGMVLRATPAERLTVRPRLAQYALILPHTRREFRWFMLLSVTAGCCEELLYRGFLVWALRPYVGLYGALITGVLLFGVGHAYQGRSGATKATVAGFVMSAIVVTCGSVVPAMVVHALIDASAGIVGYAVFGESAGDSTQPDHPIHLSA